MARRRPCSIAASRGRYLPNRTKVCFSRFLPHSRPTANHPERTACYRPNPAVWAVIGASQKLSKGMRLHGRLGALVWLPFAEVFGKAHEIPIGVLNKELPLAAFDRAGPIPSVPWLFEQRPLRRGERGQDRI